MKKLLIYIIFLLIIALLYFLYDQQSTSVSMFSIPPSPSPSLRSAIADQFDTIVFNHQAYHYTLTTIDSPDNLILLPNYQSQVPSQELINTYHCKILVNAGFYDKQDQPLGWLVSQNKTISPAIKSNLFNGFLWSKNQQIRITADQPDQPVDFGLQSGPLLILNNQPLPLKINNDQPRRRIIASISDNNKLIFLALVSQDSIFSGPLLEDTPSIVSLLSRKLNLNLISSINLDGGSASTFYTSDLHLKEYLPIGSFFCLN